MYDTIAGAVASGFGASMNDIPFIVLAGGFYLMGTLIGAIFLRMGVSFVAMASEASASAPLALSFPKAMGIMAIWIPIVKAIELIPVAVLAMGTDGVSQNTVLSLWIVSLATQLGTLTILVALIAPTSLWKAVSAAIVFVVIAAAVAGGIAVLLGLP